MIVPTEEAQTNTAVEVDKVLGTAEWFEANKNRQMLLLFLPELRGDTATDDAGGAHPVM